MKTDSHHVDTVEFSRNLSATVMVANGLTENSVVDALQDVLHVTRTETVPHVKMECGYGTTAAQTSVHSDTREATVLVVHGLLVTPFMNSHSHHLKTDVKSGNPATTPITTSSEYTEVRQNPDMNAAKEVSRNHSSSPTEEPGSTVNTT